MELKRSGSQPSAKGPEEYFTGSVRIDPLFQAADPSRVSASLVTFEPGARTAWHTHPLVRSFYFRQTHTIDTMEKISAGCSRLLATAWSDRQ